MTDTREPDRAFVGDIPAIHDRYLVALIFAPYARDIAERAAALGATDEIAANDSTATKE